MEGAARDRRVMADDLDDLLAPLEPYQPPSGKVVLQYYDAACRALAKAREVDEVKHILDASIAWAAYAKQSKNVDLLADAAEIRSRAERRLGQLMAAQRDTVGLNRGMAGGAVRTSSGLFENPLDDRATLGEAGIDHNLAHRARSAAAIPEAQFEQIIAESRARINDEADRLNRKIINAAARSKTKDTAVAIPEGRFGCIVIDPPWPTEKIERDVRPNQVGFEYPTMTEAELADFDIGALAADDCHLFCWTTQRFLAMALRLLDGWDFNYVCTFVWHKPGGFQPVRLPQYNCEFALYGRLGAPRFVNTKSFFTCFEAPRREHSRKPDEFYDMVRRTTIEPRIDIFSREPREGFAQYGNEPSKFSAE
jgi:N6-adenosine-specific RNA methylase IME4